MNRKILVAGATGYLGYYMVQELKKRNYWVRVLIRKEIQKEKFKNINVDEFFVGEITKPDTITNVTKDINWVFSSIGITRQKDGFTYMDVDYLGNLNLLNDAKKNNVELFQYVSVFGSEKVPKLKIIQAKEKFVEALKNSKLNYSIIRPTGYFGDMKEVLQMAKSGKVYLIGTGEYKINPISGQDLAVVCSDSLENKQQIVNVGGPKVYSQNQVAEIAFDALGIKGKIIHIPLWIRDIVVFIVRTFTSSKFYGPIEFFLTAMTIDGSTDKYGKDLLEGFYNEEAKKI